MNSDQQKKIEAIIKEDSHELLELRNQEAHCGWIGSDPPKYYASASISGTNRFSTWSKVNRRYSFLPGFGFKFTIGRQVSPPFESGIFLTSPGMIMGPPDDKDVKIRLSLIDRQRFFELLNAVRANERFAPFRVSGNKEMIHSLKATHFLTIEANTDTYEINASGERGLANIEEVILSFIDIFTRELAEFESLGLHHRDGGTQSSRYHKLRRTLALNLLRKLMAVLKEHGMKYRASWGLRAELDDILYGISEYGLQKTIRLKLGI